MGHCVKSLVYIKEDPTVNRGDSSRVYDNRRVRGLAFAEAATRGRSTAYC